MYRMMAPPVDVPINAPTYVSFGSIFPYFMKLFSVLKIFLMQMVVLVLTAVTCTFYIGLLFFLTLCIMWYSRKNTTFQKVDLLTNFRLLTVTLLKTQVIRYMTLSWTA
jgi:hypothetical protein